MISSVLSVLVMYVGILSASAYDVSFDNRKWVIDGQEVRNSQYYPVRSSSGLIDTFPADLSDRWVLPLPSCHP